MWIKGSIIPNQDGKYATTIGVLYLINGEWYNINKQPIFHFYFKYKKKPLL